MKRISKTSIADENLKKIASMTDEEFLKGMYGTKRMSEEEFQKQILENRKKKKIK